MDDHSISEAFVAAVGAVVAIVGVSPVKGLHVAETDAWKLTINASMQPIACEGFVEPIGPYEIHAESKIYFAVVVLDPTGGMLGGINESAFIAEMNAITEALAADQVNGMPA